MTVTPQDQSLHQGIDIVLEEGMNVKIVLCPTNEDPDSYSKKTSNEEFAKYIRDNETDFIRFKTKPSSFRGK